MADNSYTMNNSNSNGVNENNAQQVVDSLVEYMLSLIDVIESMNKAIADFKKASSEDNQYSAS